MFFQVESYHDRFADTFHLLGFRVDHPLDEMKAFGSNFRNGGLYGNIIGPKILGESTGLSPFWVVFAIFLGNGLFGVVGLFIGVPTWGVVYYLIKRYVNYRVRKKYLI